MRFVFALPIITACASISPRFDQDVAASFAHDDMRRLVTADVELYYPASASEQAHRVAARASECLVALRAHQLTQRDHGRALLFLTSANINNAFVSGQLQGEPLHSLEPLSATWELFNWYGLPVADTGDIACHEMFHSAHFEQVEGLWRYVNLIVGPIVSSQIYLEPWFTEGLAQYYEGRIARAIGRPHSPMYKGTFDAFVAARGGDLKGGDLSPSQRELLPATGAYLTGLYFVEWLAETYGEAKLWALMELQGRSLFSPLGSTLRFRSVYGASAGALLDRWKSSLKEHLVVRTRPADQRLIRADVGLLARIATHPPSGTIALVSVGLEETPTLRILSADGSMLAERRLKRLTPDRDWVSIGPSSVSGLSFSADGRSLFLLNDDLVERGDTRAQIWKIDVATLEVLRIWQDVGRGTGGSVSPDGQRYTFVELPPSGAARVVERDLETGKTEMLYEPSRGVGLGAPAWSADHTRLALALHDGNGWNLAVRSKDGRVRRLTSDGGFNYAPQWADERHLVFARAAGPYLQAHRIDVDTGRLERLSDAPYGIMDPSPVPGGVVIINRDGTHWSLDVVADDAMETLWEGAPWPAEPEEVAVARHEPPPLAVEEDSAYSPLDHLFIPQLRAPAVLMGLGKDRAGRPFLITSLYASLSGRDRLGFHNWALNAELESALAFHPRLGRLPKPPARPLEHHRPGEPRGPLGRRLLVGSPVGGSHRLHGAGIVRRPARVGPTRRLSHSALHRTLRLLCLGRLRCHRLRRGAAPADLQPRRGRLPSCVGEQPRRAGPEAGDLTGRSLADLETKLAPSDPGGARAPRRSRGEPSHRRHQPGHGADDRGSIRRSSARSLPPWGAGRGTPRLR